MNSLRLFVLLLLLFVCVVQTAQSQDLYRESVTKTLTKPPSLSTDLEVFSLLENRSVRSELKLPNKSFLEFQQITRSTRSEISNLRKEMLGNGIPGSAQLFDSRRFQIEEAELASIDRLMSTAQRNRLFQLVHYVEIAYEGLPVALADGKLGNELGVSENQRTHIRTAGNATIEKAHEAVKDRYTQFHRKALETLPLRQQEKTDELLGDYFDPIRDGLSQMLRQNNFDLRDEALEIEIAGKKATTLDELAQQKSQMRTANVSSDSTFFGLLHRAAVKEELGINKSTNLALIRFRERIQRITDPLERSKLDLRAALDDILMPSQMVRLKQLAYQQEIVSLGYAESLTDGQIGREIGVESGQKTSLKTKLIDLERLRDRQVREIREIAHKEVLNLLSPQQSKKASETLGPFFEFIDGKIAAKRDILAELYIE